MIRRILTLSLIAAAPLCAAFPAAAQDDAGDKVNMVIVYGDDACPTPAEGEITVCARKEEDERFRIPENLRYSDDPQNTAWTERVERYEMVGAFGTMSCDPAGAGGWTGGRRYALCLAGRCTDKKDGRERVNEWNAHCNSMGSVDQCQREPALSGAFHRCKDVA